MSCAPYILFGYHAVFDPNYRDALLYASANGFSYVAFDLNVPRFFLQDLSAAETAEIAGLARDLGVGISFHAPGDNISLFTDYPEIRRGILAHFAFIAERANSMGAARLTVPPGFRPSFRKHGEKGEDYQSEYEAYYGGVFRENPRFLAGLPLAVCVENQPLDAVAAEALEALAGMRYLRSCLLIRSQFLGQFHEGPKILQTHRLRHGVIGTDKIATAPFHGGDYPPHFTP